MGGENGTGFRCGICGGCQPSGTYEAREMMFGLRTPFHYAQCGSCGSLWLMDPPADFGPYYPRRYYSFRNGNGGVGERVRTYLRTKRDGAFFGRGGVLGRLLARRYGENAILSVSKLSVSYEARILDVGCGSGKLLHRMAAVGFKNLAGVDPYLSDETRNGNGMRIRKCRLMDLAGEKFDVVMFHHSLEHIADPASTLRAAAGLLSPGGKCLVRLPVVARAWEQYKANWVQLDPPRHVWVPTEKAMEIVAEAAGLRVERVEYDSTEFQFWESELYARNVAQSETSQLSVRSVFSGSELRRWRDTARRLNCDSNGDQAVFYLKRA
jgi:SAM-dependent methyltransferase